MATLGGFELSRDRPGAGGMANLYFARRTQPLPGFPKDQSVVVKMVPTVNQHWYSALLHEASILKALRDLDPARFESLRGAGIAHIQPVALGSNAEMIYVGHGMVDGWDGPEPVDHTFIVLDDIRGVSLRDYVEATKDHRLPLYEAVSIVYRLARTVRVLHEDGRVFHNDLKPDNVVIGPGQAGVRFRVTLIDFGISLHMDEYLEVDRQTHDMAYWGVVEYMAPEKRMGRRQTAEARMDWRAEVWSLGAVLLYTLGRNDILRRDTESGLEMIPGVPPGLQAFLRRSMDPSPSNRHASWEEVVEDLRLCVQEAMDSTKPETGSPPWFDWERMQWWVLGAGVAALLAAVGGLLVLPALR